MFFWIFENDSSNNGDNLGESTNLVFASGERRVNLELISRQSWEGRKEEGWKERRKEGPRDVKEGTKERTYSGRDCVPFTISGMWHGLAFQLCTNLKRNSFLETSILYSSLAYSRSFIIPKSFSFCCIV
jgi:hypothetical protein